MNDTYHTQLHIHLLGEFRILAGERTVKGDEFRLRKAQSLVKQLAIATNHRLLRDQLSEVLWPELEPDRAANNLYQAVHVARHVFEKIGLPSQEILQFNNEMLCLCPNWPLWVDVEAFETFAARTHSSQDPADYQSALELYSGDLLPEDLYEDWAANRRELLRQEELRLLLEFGRLNESNKSYLASIDCFQKAVAVEPASEEAHFGLMRVHAMNGQRSAALAQFESCRQYLLKELGVEPSSQTLALYQQILTDTVDGSETTASKISGRSGNFQPPFPTWQFPFLGRKDLLSEIQKILNDINCRLLTLTGPGGSGKTRLAVEAARDMVDSFPDGICFVPLAGIQSHNSLVPTLAQALGFSFHEYYDIHSQLLDHLHNKSLLLIMDNFEHLLAGIGIVADILSTAPRVKIMTTSRVRLNLIGETLLPVSGLEFPKESPDGLANALQASGVQLFMQGAQRITPGFTPTAIDLEQITRICRLVQGMPLSILLASTWMRLLSPMEIAEQIASHNLDILESDWTDIPNRQRSLRAVFDHSWSLLDRREQSIFAGLSVFRGGFTYAAAMQVCGASLRDLKQLVDHSLIHPTSMGRIQLHELIRQYGEERLTELPHIGLDVSDRHTRYYLTLLNRFALETKSPRQVEAEKEMNLEIENAQAAWTRAIERNQMEWIKMSMEGLGFFYMRRVRYMEGELAFHQAVDRCEADANSANLEQTGLWATLWAWHIRFHQLMGDSQFGQKQLKRNLEMLSAAEQSGLDVRREKAFSLLIMGSNRDEEAKSRLAASLAYYHELKARWEESFVLLSLGLLAQYSGNNLEALRCIQESMAINRESGYPIETNESLRSYAWILSLMGQTEEGDRIINECVIQCRLLDDKSGLAEGLYILGCIKGQRGRYAEMFAPLEECAEIYERIGNRKELARTYHVLGKAYAGLGQYDDAVAFYQKSMPLFSGTAFEWGSGVILLRNCELALVKGQYLLAFQLIQDSLSALRVVNAQATIGQALPMLVIVEAKLGNLSMACQHLLETLQFIIELHDFDSNIYTLLSAVLFMAHINKPELAVDLFALASRYPLIANSKLFHDMVGKFIADLSSHLPFELIEAVKEHGKNRDLSATIEELLKDVTSLNGYRSLPAKKLTGNENSVG